LDDRLIDIILRELGSDKPVLIYANKSGAHFPYDLSYPEKARIFRPTMTETADTAASRIRSYRNVIRWSVDRILQRLIEQAPLDELNPERFTHCSVDRPDPREGLVLLFVITGNAARAQFQAAADASRDHGSHFSIAPRCWRRARGWRSSPAATFSVSSPRSRTGTRSTWAGTISSRRPTRHRPRRKRTPRGQSPRQRKSQHAAESTKTAGMRQR